MIVDLPGGSTAIPAPILATCPVTTCPGEVHQSLIFEGRLETWAMASDLDGAEGEASELVTYSIDGDLLVNDLASAFARVEASPAPSADLVVLMDDELAATYDHDTACLNHKIGQVGSPPSIAELHTVGTVSVDAGTGAFGFAQTGNRHVMQAVGFASCALEPAARVRLKDILSSAVEDPLKRDGVTVRPYCLP